MVELSLGLIISVSSFSSAYTRTTFVPLEFNMIVSLPDNMVSEQGVRQMFVSGASLTNGRFDNNLLIEYNLLSV